MKKLFIIATLILMFVPLSVLASANESTAPYIPKPDFLPGPESQSESLSGAQTQEYILNSSVPDVIKMLLGLFGIGAFLSIMISAINMLIAWGNEDKVTQAKKNLQFSLLGLAISIFAYAMVAIIVSLALPRESSAKSRNLINYIVPSVQAADENLDILLPSQYEFIESQGEESGRNTALVSGDLISEVIPSIVVNIMFAASFLIFIGFMYGGILMIYGRGNEDQVTKAKNIIIYSAIALVLMGFAYAIVYGLMSIDFSQNTNSNADDVYVNTSNE